VPVSGLEGQGLDALMHAVIRVHEVWNKRISTARLNRWLSDALEHTPPPAIAGRRIKIRYMTQLRARPPYFIIFGNQLAGLPVSYERFLINGLRQTFDLPGVPIRISKKTSENPYGDKRREHR
jgi:GTP-binding protein